MTRQVSKALFALVLIVLVHGAGCDEGNPGEPEPGFIESDTLIVYDFQSKEVSLAIPRSHVLRDADFTQSYLGTLNNRIASLPTSTPVDDLIEGSRFTKLERAKELGRIDDFPIRAHVKVLPYANGEQGACSGQLVGPNL